MNFTTVQGRIYTRHVIIPSQGGAPLAQLILPPGAFAPIGGTPIRWTADSQGVIYIDRNKAWNVMRQPIMGGPPVALTRFNEGRTLKILPSPDGQWIALVRRIGRKRASGCSSRGRSSRACSWTSGREGSTP
jgi:hypothetical protein